MHGDEAADKKRHARALALDEVTQKLKNEYSEALAALGCMPVVQRVWNYTVEEHVAAARERGIELNARGQELQRDYLNVLRGGTEAELGFVVHILSALLEVDHLGMRHRGILDEAINALTFAEGMLERRQHRRRRATRDAKHTEEERES